MAQKHPDDRLYTDTHDWIYAEGNDVVSIGITDYAQELLGECVFIELPEIGQEVGEGDEAGVIESTKTATDIYFPVSGRVVDINQNLIEQPDVINAEPYDEGWLYRIELSDVNELDTLMSAEHYHELVDNVADDRDQQDTLEQEEE